MNDILIIGAGITGLVLAWELARKGVQVRILEQQAQVGGNIRSLREQGYLVDLGPNSLLERPGEGVARLIGALDIEKQVVVANPAAKRRYISFHNHLEALPTTPWALLCSPLFSMGSLLRLLGEPWRKPVDKEESVAEFVRRRLGQEFLDWAVDPFISGVYAGDAEQLSVRAATARIYALEVEAGSLIKGALLRKRRGRTGGPVPQGRLIGFREGLQELPQAIAKTLGDRLHAGVQVRALRRIGGHWVVDTSKASYEARHLVLAIPAYAAADLLEPHRHDLAEDLRGITYPGVVNLALGFPRSAVAHPLDGFGALISSREGKDTLGVLFSSTLFPGRAPEGHVLLTAFIGGARNSDIHTLNDKALVSRVLADIHPLLQLNGDPDFIHVARWPRAIPQYTLGHLERLGRIDAIRKDKDLPDIDLLGNWCGGIAVGDCVNNALALGERLMEKTE